MGNHKKFFKDGDRMEDTFIHLDIFGYDSDQIKRNRALQLISISLFTLSVILFFKLLVHLLFPNISPGYYEMTIMISSCLAVNLAALLILCKYQSLLKNLEYRHRSLVENVSEGILLLDTKGNFLKADKKMEGLLGFSEAELLTMNLTQVLHKKEHERSLSTLETVVQTGKSVLPNGWIVRKDDQMVPVDFFASKVEFGGKTIIQGIFRDLTEARKLDAIQAQLYRDHLSFLQKSFKVPSYD